MSSSSTTTPTRNLAATLVAVLFLGSALLISLTHAHGDHSEVRPVSTFSFFYPFFPEAGLAAVPNWEVRGGTMVTADYIRLTPDIGGRSGLMLSRRAAYMKTFEITLHFRIHGANPRLGADGLVFWILKEPLNPGPVFGGQDRWDGVAIIMDTFDNNQDGKSPSIGIHVNDGTKSFEMNQDGSPTLMGSCLSTFRNAQLSYIHLYYENGYLHLYHDPQAQGAWELCTGPFKVDLPPLYYFGFSAATGGLSDNHDLMAMTVNTMDPMGQTYGDPLQTNTHFMQQQQIQREAEEKAKVAAMQARVDALDERQEQERLDQERLLQQQQLQQQQEQERAKQQQLQQQQEQATPEKLVQDQQFLQQQQQQLSQQQAEFLEKMRVFEENERKLTQERDQIVRRNSAIEERENSLAVKEYRLKQQEEERVRLGDAVSAGSAGSSKALVDIEGRLMALADVMGSKFSEQSEALRRLEQDIDDVQAVSHSLASIFVHKTDIDTLRAAIFTELTRLAAHVDTLARSSGSGSSGSGETIKSIENNIAALTRNVDRISPRLQELEVKEQRQTEQLLVRIGELQYAYQANSGGAGSGWWIYFVLAEAILLISFMVWRKMRSTKQMKLY